MRVWKISLKNMLVIFTVLIFGGLLHWNILKRCWFSYLYRTPGSNRYLLMLYLRKWNAMEWVVMTTNGATKVKKLRTRCDVYLMSIVSNLYLSFLTWKRLNKNSSCPRKLPQKFFQRSSLQIDIFHTIFLVIKNVIN